MKAIILAAGRGSRMKHLTHDAPKCLVTLRGKSLLDWQLKALREAGVTDIAIVTGYKREMLSNRGLIEFHNARWAETNMVSSLAAAEEWLAREVCIVSYSDIFYQSSAITTLIENPSSLAVTFDPNWKNLWEKRFADILTDAETFRLSADNTLTEIGNKPVTVEEIQGQYMGLLRFTPEGWKEIQRIRDNLSLDDRDKIHMTGILQKVIEHGRIRIAAIPYLQSWGEVDSESDLRWYDQSCANIDISHAPVLG